MFAVVLLSFFNAAYTLYLYSYSQFGSIYSGLCSCSLGYVREFLYGSTVIQGVEQ
jgi:NADH-ubiquinone oxidoreductase chain 4